MLLPVCDLSVPTQPPGNLPRCQTIQQLPIAHRINVLSSWSASLSPPFSALSFVHFPPAMVADCFSPELAMAPISWAVPLEHTPHTRIFPKPLLPTLQVSTQLPLSQLFSLTLLGKEALQSATILSSFVFLALIITENELTYSWRDVLSTSPHWTLSSWRAGTRLCC